MGCKKKNKLSSSNNIKKIVLAVLVSMMWIACFTPIVFSDEDTVTISFDPTGAVNVEVYPITMNFSTVAAGHWETGSVNYLTIRNNGSIRIDTQVKVCHTKNLIVDSDGTPATDYFSLYTSGLSNDAYVPYAYGAYQSQDLNPGTPDTFTLNIGLGNISANHSWQNAYVNFSAEVG